MSAGKAALFTLFVAIARGQTQTSTLRGTVRDASGANVPDAAVSLNQKDRQQQWIVRTAGNANTR